MNHKYLSFFYRIDDQYAIFETSSSVRAIRSLLRTEVNTKIHQPSSRPTLHIGRDFLGFIIGCSLRTGIWARGWWWLFLRPFLELHRVLVSLSTMDCWFTITAVLPKLVDLAWWSRLVLLRRFSPEDWSFSIFPGRKCCRELFWTWALRWLIEIPRTGVVVAFFSWVWSMVLWWRCRRYRRSYRWIYRQK